jgi:hypothetical protein
MNTFNPYTNVSDGIGETGNQVLSDINSNFNSFGNNKYVSGTREFLESNSLVAKVAFLLLVVIVFVLLVRLGIIFLGWMLGPTNSPYLVKGMKSGKEFQSISQDPKIKSSIPLLRSRNEDEGLEFTYATWIYIDDITYKQERYRHIFNKGNDSIVLHGADTGLIYPNNAPGLYLAPSGGGNNELLVIMNSFNNVNEEIPIKDIPIKKWIHVVIRVEGDVTDVYINGNIAARKKLNGVPKQNYGPVNINLNGGFDGFLSDLRYWDYGLSIGEIDKLVNKGPNQKMNKSLMQSMPPYLSLRWYINN